MKGTKEKGGKIMNLTWRSLITTIVLVIGLAGIAAAQASRLSEKEMKDLLGRIDKQAEAFQSSLKHSLDHSRIDDTKREDRINDFVKDFQKATDRLKERYNDKNTASSVVEEVLTRAARIDEFMSRHQLSPRAENDWAGLRDNLDTLAEAYAVTWSWDRRN
jgi:hypothetical protein